MKYKNLLGYGLSVFTTLLLALASIVLVILGFGKDGKGVKIMDTDVITLSTLANLVVIRQSNPLSIIDPFRMISLEIAATLAPQTEGEVLIGLYLASDELSVTEISTAIRAAGPLGAQDHGGNELASRPIFCLGHFQKPGLVVPLTGPEGQEGVIKKTIRWTFQEDFGWALYAFNHSGATLTGNQVIRMEYVAYGVWVGS